MTGFLVDAGLPRQTAPLIIASGHHAVDVRDIGLGAAPDEVVAAYARQHNLAILTRDRDFGDVRRYEPGAYKGIVVFEFSDAARRDFILGIIDSLLRRSEILEQLPGRLAIVEIDRVRLWPR